MRRGLSYSALFAAVIAATLIPATSAMASFSDVPTSYWDYTAINYVAQQHTWMQDYGTSTFEPTAIEQRNLLARTLVTVYAPLEPIDPTITFSDVPTTDPFYRYINVATKLGWLPGFDDGTWRPTGYPYTRTFDKALILAMGKFSTEISGLQHIHTTDGTITYTLDSYGPYMQLAHWLEMHYNHGDETLDLDPKTYTKRDEVAYSLWKATTMSSSTISSAAAFNDISLPNLDSATQAGKLALTRYALLQIGYPYVWGGEWNTKTPSGYCCGSQPIGGMDCSGFVWWSMKRYEDGYNAAQYHPDYTGWSIPQRTSSDMAASSVDHVGIYLGNNWMIHSSGSNDGVALEPVASGWYTDHFVWARRILTSSNSTLTKWYDPTGGDGPRQGGRLGL